MTTDEEEEEEGLWSPKRQIAQDRWVYYGLSFLTLNAIATWIGIAVIIIGINQLTEVVVKTVSNVHEIVGILKTLAP